MAAILRVEMGFTIFPVSPRIPTYRSPEASFNAVVLRATSDCWLPAPEAVTSYW